MKTETALKFFQKQAKGTPQQHISPRQLLAEAAGTTRQYVARWVKSGVVPAKFAILLQTKTANRLKVDPRCYEQQQVTL